MLLLTKCVIALASLAAAQAAASDPICDMLPGSRVVRVNGSQPEDHGTVVSTSLIGRLVEVKWDSGATHHADWEELSLIEKANASSHEAIHTISGPAASGLLRVGTVVVRGPDWKYGCQDGVPRSRGRVIGDGVNARGNSLPHWHLVQWADGYLGQYQMAGYDDPQLFDLAVPTHEQDFSNAAVHEDWRGLLRNGSCVVGGQDRQTGDERWEEYQMGRVVDFDASQDAGWMYVRWRSGIAKNYTMGKNDSIGASPQGWAPLGLGVRGLRLLDNGSPAINKTCGLDPCAGFECYDGTCVAMEAKCNGPLDCPDGSDEDENGCADPEFETSFHLGDWKVVEVTWHRFQKNIQIGAFSNVSSSIIVISADQGQPVSFRPMHGCNWQGDFCKDQDKSWTEWLPESPDIVSTKGVKFVVHRRPQGLAVWVFGRPTTPPATVPVEEGADRLRVRPDAGSWFMDIYVAFSNISETEAAKYAHGGVVPAAAG